MRLTEQSRRGFLTSVSAGAVGLTGLARVPSLLAQQTTARRKGSERLRVAAIGMRYQGTVIALAAQKFADIVAVCDVDRHVREQARASFGSTPRIYEDYRQMLAAGGFEVVTIGAPDHWHAKILIDACRAGKDVYCEKPLTLTVDEGKQIRDAVKQSGRIVQVGSWQRSDARFRLAAEMVRQGRIGKLRQVEVVLSKNESGGPFRPTQPPPNLNWDLWQGPTPSVPYIPQRCHYSFRWWYEYAGGEMTDWGAHHLDIAQWAIGELPVEIESTAAFPHVVNGYNVATAFSATYRYPGGVVMSVSDTGRNGILFSGSEGRIFVNRASLSGKPVEELVHDPLPREQFTLYDFDDLERPPRTGKLDAISNHMANFFDCVQSRRQPISDIESQHRSAATCHLGNISMWLGRSLKWDPVAERFIDDAEANGRLRRDQRRGFEIG